MVDVGDGGSCLKFHPLFKLHTMRAPKIAQYVSSELYKANPTRPRRMLCCWNKFAFLFPSPECTYRSKARSQQFHIEPQLLFASLGVITFRFTFPTIQLSTVCTEQTTECGFLCGPDRLMNTYAQIGTDDPNTPVGFWPFFLYFSSPIDLLTLNL